jgi:ELWxxDGT repeat protein
MKKHVYVVFFLMLCIWNMPRYVVAQPQRLGNIPADSRNFIAASGSVYFFSGTHLWGSDGTAEGTRMIKDIGEQSVEWEGQYYQDLRRPDLSFGENQFFFMTKNAQGTYSLWISDGTSAGTKQVTSGRQNINPLTEYAGAFYFSIRDEASGAGLYKVEENGSLSQVAALVTGRAAVFNNALYFAARDTTGNAIWKYAGTEPELVLRLPEGRLPNEMLAVNNTLFFSFYPPGPLTSPPTYHLWKSDGSPEGTVQVKEFTDEEFWFGGEGYLYQFVAFENRLYFMHGNSFISDFWVSDGTTEGTRLIKKTIAFDGEVIKTGVIDTLMYIAATGQNSYLNIWYSDGTTEGTQSRGLQSLGYNDVEHTRTHLFYTDVDGSTNPGGGANNLADAYHVFRNGVPLRSIYGQVADLNMVNRLKASGDRLFFSRVASDGSWEFYVYEPGPPSELPVATSLVLVNADTNQDIMPLRQGMVINLQNLSTKNLNIRAVINPSQTGSVVFSTEGVSDYSRTENDAPYAYRGDRNGNYHRWVPTAGEYSITATPYTEASGRGTAGAPITIHFTITDPGPTVTGFALIDADRNQVIWTFGDGTTINLNELPTRNLNIAALTTRVPVGSIQFNLEGAMQLTRTENVAPYALAGDRNGDYYRWTPIVGSYTLTATPYALANARGDSGISYTVRFEVIDRASSSSATSNIQFSAYPNPFSDRVQLELEALHRSKVVVEVFDLNGLLIQRLYNRQVQENQSIRLELDGSRLRDGVYLVKVSTDKEVTFHRLMLAR